MKSEKEINYLRAERYSDAFGAKLNQADEKAWWNKLKVMDKAELEMLPYSFMKKYGSYLNLLKKLQMQQRLDENLGIGDNAKTIRHLDELMTDQEK